MNTEQMQIFFLNTNSNAPWFVLKRSFVTPTVPSLAELL